MAENIMNSGKAIDYLNKLYGIETSYVTLRNWVLKGRNGICLSATSKKMGNSGRVRYSFTAHNLSTFVKAVGGKATLVNLTRGRPIKV